MTEHIIELKNISKSFDKKAVLDNVNLTINKNEVVTIIGKSGVGKSVTLKLIMGLMRPDSGEILFNGKSYNQMSKREREEWRANISFMFQNNALFDSLTVFENIAMPLIEKERHEHREIEERVNKIIKVLELEDSKYKYPSQLSGGMQKRVALARALVTNPKIVLFDEPTTGLDPMRKNNVLSMISHNQKNFGFTGILVSHDVPDVFYISNRVAIIDEGKFLFEGSPLELIKNPHASIKPFINSLEELRYELLNIRPVTMLENELKGKEKPIRIPYLYIEKTEVFEKYNELTVFTYFNLLIDVLKENLFNTKKVKLFKISDWNYLFYSSENVNSEALKNYKNFDIVKKFSKIGADVELDLVEISETKKIIEICEKNNSISGVDNGKQV